MELCDGGLEFYPRWSTFYSRHCSKIYLLYKIVEHVQSLIYNRFSLSYTIKEYFHMNLILDDRLKDIPRIPGFDELVINELFSNSTLSVLVNFVP